MTSPHHTTGVNPNTTPEAGGRGFYAWCDCGWVGPHRADHTRARQDAAEHGRVVRARGDVVRPVEWPVR